MVKNAPVPMAQIRADLTKMTGQFQTVLPPTISAERFNRVIFTQFQKNPRLLECAWDSTLSAIMTAAERKLLPDGRFSALVPYWDKNRGCFVCQWQPMYQGLLHLARGSGMIENIFAYPVYANDQFRIRLGDNPGVDHEPSQTWPQGELVQVYAFAKVLGETLPVIERMFRQEVDEIRARSKAKSGPWQTDYNEMARKTVLKRILKFLPQDTPLQEALDHDDRVEFGGELNVQETMPAPEAIEPPEEKQKRRLAEIGNGPIADTFYREPEEGTDNGNLHPPQQDLAPGEIPPEPDQPKAEQEPEKQQRRRSGPHYPVPEDLKGVFNNAAEVQTAGVEIETLWSLIRICRSNEAAAKLVTAEATKIADTLSNSTFDLSYLREHEAQELLGKAREIAGPNLPPEPSSTAEKPEDPETETEEPPKSDDRTPETRLVGTIRGATMNEEGKVVIECPIRGGDKMYPAFCEKCQIRDNCASWDPVV